MVKLYNQAYRVYSVTGGEACEDITNAVVYRLLAAAAAAAAAISPPASSEQQQQNFATLSLSVNSSPNKCLSVNRKRNLSRMQIFAEFLGMFEWLSVFSLCPPPLLLSVSLSLHRSGRD